MIHTQPHTTYMQLKSRCPDFKVISHDWILHKLCQAMSLQTSTRFLWTWIHLSPNLSSLTNARQLLHITNMRFVHITKSYPLYIVKALHRGFLLLNPGTLEASVLLEQQLMYRHLIVVMDFFHDHICHTMNAPAGLNPKKLAVGNSACFKCAQVRNIASSLLHF